jgi:predicted nucleotidyltransferase component of viral defense system
MIPQAFITQWRNKVPWRLNEQIEQDLIICRSLIEIFSDPALCESLAFRGGTALHKLFLPQPMRYSEDIDLVQIKPEPIGPIFDALRKTLKYMGKGKITQKMRNNLLTFTVQSTIPPVMPIKLKIEINCREHIDILGPAKIPFSVESGWFTGKCEIRTYSLEELLGSKLRALYQRRKGRDLFDLWLALTLTDVSIPRIIKAFHAFMMHVDCHVSAAEFIKNMTTKMKSATFRNDTTALLRQESEFDIDAAWEIVRENLVAKINQ